MFAKGERVAKRAVARMLDSGTDASLRDDGLVCPNGVLSMARVEWTRHPDDVEPVVGMLICSHFPNAVRVQPSQGDGGIDIFVPGPRGFAAERAVYQVKSYCKNRLTSSQKAKIKRSFNTVVETAAAEGWTITEWHLVMPMDPTDNELKWLKGVTIGADFPCETNGLLYCDTLAARFPKVIDYYLHDGRERLQEQMNNLAAVLSGRKNRDENDEIVASDVVPDLAGIHKALNACDPFYKYDFTVSDSPPPDGPLGQEQPGLVAVFAMRQDSVWITFKIYALSLAALKERPIGAQFTVAIPRDDEELRQQFERFVDYGAPMQLPPGTISGSVDFPGGLGGEVTGASLAALSNPNPLEDGDEPAEFLLAIVAAGSDTVLASTTMRRTEFTAGQAGVRSVFVEKSGIFTLELRMRSGSLDGEMTLHTEYDLSGRRPAEFVDGLNVLAAWNSPNRIAFGMPYGPPDFGVVATIDVDRDRDAVRWARVCESLARIQDHVSVLLRMPEEMDIDQFLAIRDVAKLVSGESVIGTVSGDFTITHNPDVPRFDADIGVTYEFMTIKSIEFTLGEVTITVGKSALFFRTKFVRIEDDESEIALVGQKGISVLYTGDLPIGHVLVRRIPEPNDTEA